MLDGGFGSALTAPGLFIYLYLEGLLINSLLPHPFDIIGVISV